MTTTLQLASSSLVATATASPIFSRVLLAIDFGSASLGAARWGTTHIASEADAVLMHVMPFADGQPCTDAMTTSDDQSLRRMTPALVGGLGGFGATLNVASSRSVVRVGRPSGCLAAVANDTEASLLVLGRRADANRVRVGEPNVIERVARRTSASVLVVPEGTLRGPDHIVAAVDESPFAPRVVEIASRLARMHEVPLTLLHVMSPVEGAYERVIRTARHFVTRGGGTRLESSGRPVTPMSLVSSTTRWLEQLARAHGIDGGDSAEIGIGDPPREIVGTAMQHEFPLVVVGFRGADDAAPGSVGSVARELLTRGPMPVLAVNAM